MNFEIVELEDYSGKKATVYSVIIEGNGDTLFEQFVEEHNDAFQPEIISIATRIELIGKKTGARSNFFKEDEGKPGDGVCALYDEEYKLRLFCIKYGTIAIVLGGGGLKKVRAWQDDDALKANAELMIKISAIITEKIKSKEIVIDGNELIGNLKFEDNE